MTNAELNRDIRRLWVKSKQHRNIAKSEYENYEKNTLPELQSELKRLYYADTSFSFLNRTSVLIMVKLNLRYRVIPLHHFGSEINLK
jgi:hypothetical protein